ncbi:MAG: ribosome maturation factor RimM [Candidatus Dormibacteraeota bacterium]|nr:ribosome maturation factor RimM [Candidatus Dormibacteraeota bacterium]
MPEASPASMLAAPALLRVAHVRRAHGVRGEVRVQMLGGDLQRFARGTVLVAEREQRRLTVAASRPVDGDEILLMLEELPTREQVAALSGDYLCVLPSQARVLADDEWFIWQLVGLRAVTDTGEDLGLVRDVEEQPSSDVIVVVAGSQERRYPLVREWVQGVDVERGIVVVTPWPEDDA